MFGGHFEGVDGVVLAVDFGDVPAALVVKWIVRFIGIGKTAFADLAGEESRDERLAMSGWR